jgi:hypothetical protein
MDAEITEPKPEFPSIVMPLKVRPQSEFETFIEVVVNMALKPPRDGSRMIRQIAVEGIPGK